MDQQCPWYARKHNGAPGCHSNSIRPATGSPTLHPSRSRHALCQEVSRRQSDHIYSSGEGTDLAHLRMSPYLLRIDQFLLRNWLFSYRSPSKVLVKRFSRSLSSDTFGHTAGVVVIVRDCGEVETPPRMAVRQCPETPGNDWKNPLLICRLQRPSC